MSHHINTVYIDPLIDFAFKKLFGSEPNKDLLIAFLIEVQRSVQHTLKQRMLFYASRLISDMAPKGSRRKWNYDIKEVYVIVLMDDFVLPGSDSGRFLHDICLCDRDTGAVFYGGTGNRPRPLVVCTEEYGENEEDTRISSETYIREVV